MISVMFDGILKYFQCVEMDLVKKQKLLQSVTVLYYFYCKVTVPRLETNDSLLQI